MSGREVGLEGIAAARAALEAKAAPPAECGTAFADTTSLHEDRPRWVCNRPAGHQPPHGVDAADGRTVAEEQEETDA